MNLRIFIPYHLFETISEIADGPALSKLMTTGHGQVITEPLEVMLCKLCWVQKQNDWPLAAISLLGEEGALDNGYWMRADPVHLVLQRDSFSLSETVPLNLSLNDSQTLIATLHQHFSPDGIKFYLAKSGAWYLHMDVKPDVSTTLPMVAAGRDINAHLPQGTDATKWSQLLNEIQMLLHDHPVNQTREATGKLAVNSIWPSGGGTLPIAAEAGDRAIFSNDFLVNGLGKLGKSSCNAFPADASLVLAQAAGDVWLVLNGLKEAESIWFAPVLAALRQRKIKQLVMSYAVRDQVLNVTVRPSDLWKFWRRQKSLQTYFYDGKLGG